jgi:F-type H+-transporting ATPase subunit delta
MILTPKVYAQAIMDKLPQKEAGPLNDLISDLSFFYMITRQSKTFRLLTARPNPYSAKKKLLDGILPKLNIGKEANAIIEVLAKQNNMSIMPKIINILKELRIKEFDIEEGETISVAPLSEDDKKRCIKLLEKISGHTILLREKTDPKIFGGLVLKCGDTIMDASILKKIKTLENLLKV